MPSVGISKVTLLQKRDSVQVEEGMKLIDCPCPLLLGADVTVDQASQRSFFVSGNRNQAPVGRIGVPDVLGDLYAVLPVRLAG